MTQPQYGAANRPRAFLGCLLSGSAIGPAPIPRKDSVGATKQITTFTANGATNSETYTVTFTSTTPGSVGDTIAITTAALDGSATVAELVAALQAAMYDTPAFMRYVDSITTTSTTVIVTLHQGQSGTYALTDNPSTDLSQAATQAQADYQEYTFGRAVEVLGPDSGAVGNERVRPLQASTYAGPEVTVAVTTADDGSDSTTVFLYTPFGGAPEIRTLTFTSTAAQGTTVDAAVSAAEALFPAATVTDGGTEALIALPPGDTISVEIATTNEGTLDTSATVTGDGDDLPRCTLVYNDQLQPIQDTYPTPTVPTTGSRRAIPTLDAGELAVATSDASISFGALAYAETADGADKGLLYDTPSATRIPVLVGPSRSPARFGSIDPADASLVSLRIGA